MDTQKLAVVQQGDHWRIVAPGGLSTELATYDEALTRAERLARRAFWQGQNVEVLIHRDAELKAYLRLRRPLDIAS
ncbi:MAG TPA: hypothetical protein VNZ85_16615 [Caulobacter sp.]|nr:hypothetical protein [Caulobacter sp.]